MNGGSASRRAWLAFGGGQRMEAAYAAQFALDQAGLDLAWSLQTIVYPSLVHKMLWERLRGGNSSLTYLEVLWLACYLAWAPLFALLAQHRPKAYQRYRTLLVLLSRLQRQLTIVWYASLFNGEAMGTGPTGVLPTSSAGILGMLLWRPGSLATLLGSYLLPIKYNAPCAAVLLLAMLHSTARQCSAECRNTSRAQASQLYAGVIHKLQHWRSRISWLRSRSSYPTTGTCEAGGPLGAGACSTAFECRTSCLAVHAWMQVVLGALLPLLVTWAIEERWRQHFQQQWLQRHAPDGAAGEGQAHRLPTSWWRPVPLVVLVAWFVICSWLLWVVIEAVLL